MSISHNMDKAKELKSNPFKIQNKMEKEQDIIQKMIDTVTKKEEASNVIEVLNQDFEGLLLKTKDPIQAWIRGTILKKLQFNNAGDLFLAKAAELGYVVESVSVNETYTPEAIALIAENGELAFWQSVTNELNQFKNDVTTTPFDSPEFSAACVKAVEDWINRNNNTIATQENILPDTNLMENNTIFNKIVAKYTLSDVLKSQLSNVVKNYDTDKEETIKAIAAITSDSEDNIKTLINENVTTEIFAAEGPITLQGSSTTVTLHATPVVETTEPIVENTNTIVKKFEAPQTPAMPFKREFTPEEQEFMRNNFRNYSFSKVDANGNILLGGGTSPEAMSYITEEDLNTLMSNPATLENFKQQFMYNPNEVNPVKEQDENAIVEKPLDYNPRALKYMINDDTFLKFSYHNLGTYDEAKDLDLIYNTYIKGDDAMEAKLKTYESYTASLKESVIESNPGFKRIF